MELSLKECFRNNYSKTLYLETIEGHFALICDVMWLVVMLGQVIWPPCPWFGWVTTDSTKPFFNVPGVSLIMGIGTHRVCLYVLLGNILLKTLSYTIQIFMFFTHFLGLIIHLNISRN